MKKFFIISVMLILPATVLAQGLAKNFVQVELGGASGKIDATVNIGPPFQDFKGEQKDAGGLATSTVFGSKINNNFWLQGSLRYFGTYTLKAQKVSANILGTTWTSGLKEFSINPYHFGVGFGFGASLTDAVSAAAFFEVGLATVVGGSLNFKTKDENSTFVLGYRTASFPEKTATSEGGGLRIKYTISASALTFGLRISL